eukprot:gene9727-7600_t
MDTSNDADARMVVDGVITEEECSELIYIARSLSLPGYRDGVYSATLPNMLRLAPHLVMPMTKVRQKVWRAVEAGFAFEPCLHVEFTGLLSWNAGANLGWHHDSNRDYLTQRHYSAVLYLNNGSEKDFKGGDLQFQPRTTECCCRRDGWGLAISAQNYGVLLQKRWMFYTVSRVGTCNFSPGHQSAAVEEMAEAQHVALPCGGRHPTAGFIVVTPRAGRLVAYSADERNIHRVTDVEWGERFTLVLWFTRSEQHSEDAQVPPLLTSPPFLSTSSVPAYINTIIATDYASANIITIIATGSASANITTIIATRSVPAYITTILTTDSASPYITTIIATGSVPAIITTILVSGSVSSNIITIIATHSVPLTSAPSLPRVMPLLKSISLELPTVSVPANISTILATGSASANITTLPFYTFCPC